jgi:hypothetical protein
VCPTFMDLPPHVPNLATIVAIAEEVTYASAHNIRLALTLYNVVSRSSLDMSRFLRGTQRPHDVYNVLPGLGLPEFRQHLCVFSGRLSFFLSSSGALSLMFHWLMRILSYMSLINIYCCFRLELLTRWLS